jgi:two-component system sensor histidine kinase UhpB
MRERVFAVGGTIQVHSRPGRGTTVLIVLPLGGASAEPTEVH